MSERRASHGVYSLFYARKRLSHGVYSLFYTRKRPP